MPLFHGRLPTIVEGTARPIWLPITCVGGSATTVYIGSMVQWTYATGDGVIPTIAASGATVGPVGVVVGTNNLTPLYNTTYQTEYTSSLASTNQTTQNARDWRMQEGMWIKSDPMPLVQVALIDRTSVLRIPIYAHATNLTMPAAAVSTAGSAGGQTVTCGTTGFDTTAVAYENTIFCRTGLNRGLYRITYDTNAGTGAKTWYQAMPYTTATVGETYVQVPFKLGLTHIDLQTTGLGINTITGASNASNYYTVECLEIHLEDYGDEYALIRFLA